MKSSAKNYIKTLWKQRGFLATWLPGTPLKLGDIGTLNKDYSFNHVSSLSNIGINFDVYADTTEDEISLVSNSSINIHLKLEGSAPIGTLGQADAGFVIDFANTKGFIMELKGVVRNRINDKIRLQKDVLAYASANGWNKDWVIVTDVVESSSGSIIISSDSKSSIEIKAKADSLVLKDLSDIANPAIEFSVTSQKNILDKIICGQGLTPMYKVAKLDDMLNKSATMGMSYIKPKFNDDPDTGIIIS
ncbi:MAG: hypothetical protein ACRCSR_10750 [Bacteroidales bacterium]